MKNNKCFLTCYDIDHLDITQDPLKVEMSQNVTTESRKMSEETSKKKKTKKKQRRD